MKMADLTTGHINSMIAAATSPAEVSRLEYLRDFGAEFVKRQTRSGETRSGWFLDGTYIGKTTRDAMQAING